MTYDLYIGDRMFSSWSLRGWLVLAAFDLPVRTTLVGLYSGTMARDLAPLAPARLVPTLRLPDGTVVSESMAIAETLAERHPDAGLWPKAPAARATARWLCAEMAAGFGALREQCPMQLQYCHQGFVPSDDTVADLDRIEALWIHARQISGQDQGWLFGDYSLADVFYTPVAARIVGYGLPVGAQARDYCNTLLGHEAVRDWRRAAHELRYDPDPYALDLPNTPWPTFD